MKIDTKMIFFYAILPAFITGLFALLPTIISNFSKPKANLTYETIIGPTLQASDGFRQIIAINVSNIGSLPLTNVLITSEVSSGFFEANSLIENTGLSPEVDSSLKKISYKITKLHPRENFVISAMINQKESVDPPKIIVRSDEVLGIPLKETSPSKILNNTEIISAILAGLSVLIMSLTLFGFQNPLSFLMGSSLKQDLLFYIPARLQLSTVSEKIIFMSKDITYLKMADILLAYGLSSEPNEHEKTIKALKSMLLIKNISTVSLNVIIDDLKTLEGSNYSEDEVKNLRSHSCNISKHLELRGKINSFLINPSVFLLKDKATNSN